MNPIDKIAEVMASMLEQSRRMDERMVAIMENSHRNDEKVAELTRVLGESIALTTHKTMSEEKWRAKSLPKMNVPDFYGVPGDEVESWLMAFELNCGSLEIGEEERGKLAVTFFRDNALTWFHRYQGSWSSPPDYRTFRRDLVSKFGKPSRQLELRFRLSNLIQKGGLDKYVQEFEAIITRVEEMTERDKIFHFIQGLEPKLRIPIAQKAPATVEEAINAAQNFNAYQQGIGHEGHAYDSKAMDVFWAREGGTRKPSWQCYRCRKWGHKKADCPEGNKQTQKNKEPHTALYTKGNNMMGVTALLNNTECEFIIDSGASTSIITAKECRKAGLMVDGNHKITLQTLAGPVQSVGWTEDVEITVQGVTTKMALLVLDGEVNLLGLNWFAMSGATIKPKDGVIEMPEMVGYLAASNEEMTGCLRDEARVQEEVMGNFWAETRLDVETMIDKGLSISEHEQMRLLLEEFREVFAERPADVSGAWVEPIKLVLKDEEPVAVRMRRYSPKEKAQMESEVEKMLQDGIIRTSVSPYQAAVLLIPKKDTPEPRFCVDYRALNVKTITEVYPLPRIDDILDSLTGSTVFSKMDLKSGYWQLPLHPESMKYTAFSTPSGHYEFTRLPFGLKNAPAVFMRLMDALLKDIKDIKVYLDDITPHSKSMEDHLVTLRKVLEVLKRYNLKLNPKKCQFGLSRLQVFGFEIDGGTIGVVEKRAQGIEQFATPENVTELRRFLGLTGYFSRFIPKYAEIGVPLYKLLEKDTEWKFDSSCEQAVKQLKGALMSEPILQLPDFTKPFRLYTDASDKAIGAILMQYDADTDQEAVVAYASKKLEAAEINYGISEKECLAIVWAVDKFRCYLHGSKFEVFTDHQALKCLVSSKELSGRLARWSMFLQEFDMVINYRPGKEQEHVDALSRSDGDAQEIQLEARAYLGYEIASYSSDIMEDGPLRTFVVSKKHAAGINRKTKNRVEREASSYEFSENQMWYVKDDKNLKVPEKEKRMDLVVNAHLLGHFGTEATYQRLKETYYWYRMYKDVARICHACKVCNQHNDGPRMDALARPTTVSRVFEKVGMDLVFGFPEDPEGYTGCLVLTEYLTKYPMVYPIKGKTAEETASKLWEYIALFGPPETIVSDQGREFVNKVVADMLDGIGTEQRVTSAYNPRANGHTERFNKTLVGLLKKLANDNPREWRKWIPFALLAYRSKIHSSTKSTPFELMFGKKIRLFESDVASEGEEEEDQAADLLERTKELIALERSRERAGQVLGIAAQDQASAQNNRSMIVEDLSAGTQVYVRKHRMNKFQKGYEGPYEIVRRTKSGNYVLKNPANGGILESSVPTSKLKVTLADPTGENHADEYEVEKILDHRIDGKSGKKSYLVKWIGYEETENLWIKEEDCFADELIAEYWHSAGRGRCKIPG
jgi:hypothetical protein